MPVLKIRQKNGTWIEVWGATGPESGETTASTPKLTTITMFASDWEGSNSPYYQVVSCSGVKANSKLDLQPTPEQIVELQDDEISLMATNTDGIVTIYAFNGKPQTDMVMKVLITEVAVV